MEPERPKAVRIKVEEEDEERKGEREVRRVLNLPIEAGFQWGQGARRVREKWQNCTLEAGFQSGARSRKVHGKDATSS